ncbi:hypothetical protein K474DRAFT_1667478 [Panus rudis PR-1116 ss-1]|nr:hypothetical protein K474DRAFT_1667478 [Panus rudis PR-1116 ss-1]
MHDKPRAYSLSLSRLSLWRPQQRNVHRARAAQSPQAFEFAARSATSILAPPSLSASTAPVGNVIFPWHDGPGARSSVPITVLASPAVPLRDCYGCGSIQKAGGCPRGSTFPSSTFARPHCRGQEAAGHSPAPPLELNSPYRVSPTEVAFQHMFSSCYRCSLDCRQSFQEVDSNSHARFFPETACT